MGARKSPGLMPPSASAVKAQERSSHCLPSAPSLRSQEPMAEPLLGDISIEKLISKSSLFQNLDDEGRKRLLEGGSLESYPPGTVICQEGDPGDAFYFIKTGAVEVATKKDGAKLKLADLAAG